MKIVYISPHLSTGGCPQFLLKKIRLLKDEHEIHCIEYADHGCFTVQKNQIREILGDRLYRVNDNREQLLDIIEKVQPDIVHLEEMPEYFMDNKIAIKLYRKDRKYKIIETSHDSSFDPKNKVYFPDHFTFVSQYQKEAQKSLGVPSDVVEYPITIIPRKPRNEALKVLGLDPNKKHVIHVGLFTPRKNQAEIVEYARSLINYPIQFHFIGNQAENFKYYWEPLKKNWPDNCTWWNERKDVDNFYQMADLLLFPSKDGVGDKETSPLVIREGVCYNIPTLIYNSPVYMNMYNKFQNIKFLDFNSKENNANKILEILKIDIKDVRFMETQSTTAEENFKIEYDRTDNRINLWSSQTHGKTLICIRELDSLQVMYSSVFDPFHKDVSYYMIPVPKAFCDLETDKYCGGLRVEIYQDEKIVHVKDFRIKYPAVEKPMVNLKNTVNPSYNNYLEFFVIRVYDKYLANKTFDTIVDVGANVGLFCEYVRRNTTCKKIYALEPNVQALKVLKDSFVNNEFVLIEKALMDKDGELEFFIDPSNSTIGSIEQRHMGSLKASYKVPGICFRTFIKENNIEYIDLLKMDIEGGEYPFFASMEKEDLDKIRTMLIEYHLQGGQSMDKEVAILMALFRGAGFKCKTSEEHAMGGFIIATR